MKKIIIAMKDRHQSQKLAIVLSSTYDSIIVDSNSKLRSSYLNDNHECFTVIFEDSKKETEFALEVENMQKSGNLTCPALQIIPQSCATKSSERILVLKKPFGSKDLIKAINQIEILASTSSIAIA